MADVATPSSRAAVIAQEPLGRMGRPEEIAAAVQPGENHWHGAAPNRFMARVAMQQNDQSGSPVTWGEHVTDEQYRGARRDRT